MTTPRPTPVTRFFAGRRFWIALAGVLIVAASILLGYRLTYSSVTLDVGGQVRRLHTQSDTVADVLAEAGVFLDPEDVVEPGLSAAVDDGLTITVRRAAVVAVEADGEVRRVRTQRTQPLDILTEQSIALGPSDKVRVDGHDYTPDEIADRTWETPPISIRVLRSTRIKVVDEGRELVLYTTQTDVGRALDVAGLDLYLADQIAPEFSAPVRQDMTITIERSVPVTLVADGKTLDTRSAGPTVGDALAAAGLAPLGPDYTVPEIDTPLEENMQIELIRVDEEIITESEPAPNGNDSGSGDTLRYRTVRVRYENGVEISRTVEAEWIASASGSGEEIDHSPAR